MPTPANPDLLEVDWSKIPAPVDLTRPTAFIKNVMRHGTLVPVDSRR